MHRTQETWIFCYWFLECLDIWTFNSPVTQTSTCFTIRTWASPDTETTVYIFNDVYLIDNGRPGLIHKKVFSGHVEILLDRPNLDLKKLSPD